MNIKYFGHSCFAIEINGMNLLFDPFITPNELAKEIDIKSIKADYIFISHAHQDHIYDALEIAKNNDSTIVSCWEITEWAVSNGHTKTHPMNIGGTWEFDFGIVQMVNAVHSSSFPDGSYGGNPAGFVFNCPNHCFYYSGDTALTMDMKLIAERYNLNFAFLPLGSNFTMDVYDAVKASKFLNCKHIIGMHFDTFPYIKINHSTAEQAFENENIKLTLLHINEAIEI